jgi:hypothetical protein
VETLLSLFRREYLAVTDEFHSESLNPRARLGAGQGTGDVTWADRLELLAQCQMYVGLRPID